MNFYLYPFLYKGVESTDLMGDPVAQQTRVTTKSPLADSGFLSNMIMRLKIVTLFLGALFSQANARSIAQEITLNKKNTELSTVLKELEKQSGYTFFYNKNDINASKKISVNFNSTPLREVLNSVLKQQSLTFEYFDKTIVVKRTNNRNNVEGRSITQNAEKFSALNQTIVRGSVVDEDGHPIIGASIRLKSDPKKATSTKQNGEFELPITSLNELLVVSFVGFETSEVKASLDRRAMRIVLKKRDNNIEEVVATGMMSFKKETFSGASNRYTQEDLKQVANTNVIQAMKSLDPSFLVMENNLSGANPNVLPNIELRGTTSITSENLRDEFTNDPNQPLFILDGFETSLRSILDLDMNRIASITINKDASSTAIYGSRASNGVVVVETIKPQPGEIRVNYTSDMNLELADLGSYNLMNAAEILEFERLSGVYTAPSHQPEAQYDYYDRLYNNRLEKVQSGIDSYWLKEPIRTGFAHRHSLYAEGGSESFLFNIGGNFKNNNAVMKNSGRKDWGGRINLIYRKDKINISNNLTISGYGSSESNYGSFSTWANLKPYYTKADATQANLDEYLDVYYNKTYLIANPLYNANQNSYDRSKNWGIANNLAAIYTINDALRVQAGLQLRKESTTAEAFISPLNSRYFQISPLLKGAFNSRGRDLFSYNANAMVTYGKNIEKHSITANARLEFSDNTNSSLGFSAQGFPLTSNGNPAFAYGYTEDGTPSSAKSVSRRNSFISALNYSYDRRYSFDASFNYDGSTSFGRKNPYSPFFSVGASWNLHNEGFLKDNPNFNMLRLRANYGITGNQNFSSTTSISTYRYLSAYSYFGQGVTLSTFANENLRWQKTNQLSGGLDATLLDNRLTVTFNAYLKKTNNLAVAVDLPASTGLMAYPFNAGDLTVKGIEGIVRYNIIQRPEERFYWNVGVTGATSSQTYNNFDNKLAGMNKSLQNSNSLKRYKDGYSPNTLWAVQSLGIDPATGREIYLKIDGSQTFDYDAKDIVALGNGNPAFQGVLSTTLNYKGFSMSAYMRYIWNQDVMNTALFNKVENISLSSITSYNQDKRALYDRWKEPGDIAQFKGIGLNDLTRISSRFIQQENSFSFESISLGYDFKDYAWIKRAGLSNLRITGITNEIGRWSTIRRERGIDYPYSKMYSITINAKF